MTIDLESICIDTALGTLILVIVAATLGGFKNYSSFIGSYYYYLAVMPFFAIAKLMKIFLPIDESHSSQDREEINPVKKNQIQDLLQLSIASLVYIILTCIELITGTISVTLKAMLTKKILIDEVYLICYTPGIISLIPLYLPGVKKYLPIEAIEKIYNPYNFIGVLLNTMIILIGGLIGFYVSSHYLIIS
jgi:hypothetical protein